MNTTILVVLLAAAVAYGTPLLYAALGELLAERAGVLNLGVEGMMLMGAVSAYWTVNRVGGGSGPALTTAIVVAALVGAAIAAIHAFLSVTLRASQIVSGLALTIFAGQTGLSSYFGDTLQLGSNPARHTFASVFPSSLTHARIVGPILFDQSLLVYLSWVLVAVVFLYLTRTRPGLNARAVGEAPGAADAIGVSVVRYRYAHTMAGGALAGIGGACFSISITPTWVNGITGGAGWIAIALVIFAFWRPELCLVGAYAFGAAQSLSPVLQARGYNVSVYLTDALPYLLTIAVLVVVSTAGARRRLGAPAALGVPYAREER